MVPRPVLSVRVGGVETTELRTRQLYERVGFVFQEPYLMQLSIRDNNRLGEPEASEERVVRATKAAQIHERVLALPRGYDSVLGRDAVLPGGEQQRLAIARAMLRDAPILVLDGSCNGTCTSFSKEVTDRVRTVGVVKSDARS